MEWESIKFALDAWTGVNGTTDCRPSPAPWQLCWQTELKIKKVLSSCKHFYCSIIPIYIKRLLVDQRPALVVSSVSRRFAKDCSTVFSSTGVEHLSFRWIVNLEIFRWKFLWFFFNSCTLRYSLSTPAWSTLLYICQRSSRFDTLCPILVQVVHLIRSIIMIVCSNCLSLVL